MTKTKTATPVAAKPVSIKLLTGSDSINKAITSISKRGKAIDKDLHTVAVSCMAHADKHGDVTLANKLVAAMPKTARTNALRDWFLAFGKFSYDSQNKSLAFNRAAVTDLNKATNTPFWEFKPEATYVPFNAVAFLQAAIKRVERAASDGETVPAEVLTGLPAILKAISKPDVLAA